MELRQLRYLTAVADTGTFIAAAEQERVAQPALWQQVKALERELGVTMFERSGRRVRLTATGSAIVTKARTVLDSADALQTFADDVKTGHAGIIRIACLPPHVSAFLAAVIGRFRSERPGVDVDLKEFQPGEHHAVDNPASSVLTGRSEIGVGSTVPPGCDSFRIYRSQVILAVPDDHPWRFRKRVDVRALRGQRVVAMSPGSMSRTHLESACASAGFEPVIAASSSYPASVVALGVAGIGCPVLADDAAGLPGKANDWPLLTSKRATLGSDVYLYWVRDRPRSRTLDLLIADLRSAARE